jgi:hypothetical protein
LEFDGFWGRLGIVVGTKTILETRDLVSYQKGEGEEVV